MDNGGADTKGGGIIGGGGWMRAVLIGIFGLWLSVAAAMAQELSALARLEVADSSLRDQGRGVEIALALSQPVPWRVRLMADPPRLVLDVREVDWSGIAGLVRRSDRVRDLRAGVFRPGWSRLVLELSGPFTVSRAGMVTEGGGARIDLRLDPASDKDFAARAALPDPAGWALPKSADLPPLVARGAGPLVVVLDPGHGGLDPGAERDGLSEAGLMLTFARELKDSLLRSGDFMVVMTREEDVFVPLESRISIARAAGAHVFLSLHADALAEGEAVGATLYTLSEAASDRAAATLAERHDRDDLLAGIDLTEQDDLVARVLMDMARTQTAPRVDRLAQGLETAIKAEGLAMHRHPRQSGGFSVLKSPDIP
ncbi:MAG: N-acetylmuramoyl-L-alanine amidase, partial [Paracoccaceae bacterium]|nr:N-acetylmuramoyl-L-alanine amidase [Paracoccaceae bacterium]